jgi:uncharacterized integral membrane protein (TIGR00698 family)
MDGLLKLPLIYRRIIFVIFLALCLSPYIDPPLALLSGIILAQLIGHPYYAYNSRATKYLLQFSIVGLGFGMNLFKAMQAGKEGLFFTIGTITAVLTAGYLIGRWLKVEKVTSYLLSAGTAICGGSAIAAISPLVRADEKQISVALGTVFILNSVALFTFPLIGHYLHLSQLQFGFWSAIAIHDTSSVVGAASKYGALALETATTVKLERALWIIPLALFTAVIFKSKGQKIKIPYFILYFVIAMAISTFFIPVQALAPTIVMLAKKGFTLTLFLIGAGLSRKNLQTVGIKPFIEGILLWLIISVSSLLVILRTVG